jgi:hypothetical protein
MVFFLSEKAFHLFSVGELQVKSRKQCPEKLPGKCDSPRKKLMPLSAGGSRPLDTGIRSEMTLNRRFSGQAPLDDCRVNRLLFTTPETPCPISPYEVSANSLANLSLNSGS